MPEVIKTKEFLRIEEYPFTVAKIVRFRIAEQFDDFKVRPSNYVKKQVPGFRIILIHAGFVDKATEHICDDVIEKQIGQMISWYTENGTTNKRERNNYQISK